MSVLSPKDVTACLVTRGDQPEMIARIIETLPYDEVIVWDNSKREDLKIYGRFAAMREASNEVCYTQDDDCLFRHHADLLAEYEDGVPTYVYGHYPEEGGYGDLPLPCGGALVPRSVAFAAFDRYFEHWPEDEALHYEADFVVGPLYPTFKQVHLPFEIEMPVAQHASRLCNQPWQADLKLELTNRARAIRDSDEVKEFGKFYVENYA
jgi:hypothetical protein